MPAWLLVVAHKRNARAAVFVVHHQRPRERRAAAPRALPLYDDVVAVRCPDGAERAEHLVVEDRFRILAVGIHQPEIILAFAVADERDGLSVGRKARRLVERDAG